MDAPDPTPGSSLATRALVAVALMIAFFAAALSAVVWLVIAAIWLVLTMVHDLHGRGMVVLLVAAGGCVGAAAVIAWSILPRFDRFEPPGPELTARDYPALFALLAELAARTGQRPPAHVYLVHEPTAFVTERGGVMGLGSRRVLALGLPLVQALTVGELRAVIAHEYGHFHGGDTRLGPWIYTTRAALVRTVINLDRVSGEVRGVDTLGLLFAIVRAPFRWFLRWHLGITQAISRAQELGADALAVRTCGAPALIGGLEKAVTISHAHRVYLEQAVEPLLRLGYLPPLGAGFARFLDSPRLPEVVDGVLRHALGRVSSNPYDSHPPLGERIAAARALAAPAVAADDRPAVALLPALAVADRTLTDALIADDDRLRPVTWAESGALLAHTWREPARRARRLLKDYTPATLPADLPTLRRLCDEERNDALGMTARETVHRWATGFYGAVLIALLVGAGFEVDNVPGQPLRLRKGALTIEPHELTRAYVTGELSADAWVARWTEAGIADARIASVPLGQGAG